MGQNLQTPILYHDNNKDLDSEWSEGQDLQRLVASVEVFQPHRRRKDEPEGELS